MRSAAINFFRSTFGQVLLFVVVFAFCKWLWTFSFYSGFNGGFEQLGERMGDPGLTGLLKFVPFYSGSIFLGAFWNPIYAAVLIFSAAPFFLQKKYFPANNYSFSKFERLFFALIALVIGWELATYDYNYYLDRAFHFDRALLIVLPVLIFRFPQLIILFVGFALAYRAQFNYPVDGFPMFDKRLLFDLLMCGVAIQYCRIFVKDFKLPVMYFVLCIIASAYFTSGLKKIMISPHGYEWVLNNDPLNLFNNVHLRGWLACSSESTIDSLRWTLNTFGDVFQWFILLIEVASAFLLSNRRIAIGLLLCFFAMHIGIFIFGSMLFWKWMIVDVAVCVVLWKNKIDVSSVFADRKMKLISVALIGTSFFWLKPIPIGWHDTNVNQYYTYEVLGTDGKTYQLDKNEMNPYHQWFQYDQFDFLSQQPSLPISGFGYTYDYHLASILQEADSSNIYDLTAPVNFDESKKEKYDNFIQEYFSVRNRRLGEDLLWTNVSPPHHLYSEVCENPYRGQIVVSKFRVMVNLVYTTENQSHVIVCDTIDEIVIPLQE